MDSGQLQEEPLAVIGRRSGADRRDVSDRRRHGGHLYRARLPGEDDDRRRQDRRENAIMSWFGWLFGRQR